jgi:tRNA U34 5-methylaminomethyl-2-thiouridine-forming methyltransferase MnmC
MHSAPDAAPARWHSGGVIPHPTSGFRLVPLRNGALGVFAEAYGETMHPAIGPAAEAEALYVRQLRLRERLAEHAGEFVIWDVGLGGAANAAATLRAAGEIGGTVRLVSFENSLGSAAFALEHTSELGYLAGLGESLRALIERRRAEFAFGQAQVRWELVVADFPQWLAAGSFSEVALAPHAILFDPFSPARNPAMWTLDVFTNLFRCLDPARPCALATYSRSTMTRASLLLAGFWVGAGEASGAKEETTLAANAPSLLARPLDQRWLERARRSDSAEPLRDAVYRRAPLAAETWERLGRHPQFAQRPAAEPPDRTQGA